jgi:hypothetical protein
MMRLALPKKILTTIQGLSDQLLCFYWWIVWKSLMIG